MKFWPGLFRAGRMTVFLLAVHGMTEGMAATPRLPDTLEQRLVACTACHGKDGRATQEGYYPRIAGKPAGYLYNQLLNFRDGRRHSPIMRYMINHQPESYLHEMAVYFASQHHPYSPPQPIKVTPAVYERGRILALKGDAGKKIPACIACHGAALTGIEPSTPGLLGLPRDYLGAQLNAWSNGMRRTAKPDCMAHIANQLSGEDISAVTAWLASQPIPEASAMAARVDPSLRFPLPCGSVPH